MDSDLKKIGKYEIVSTLGEGAMGIVYKGFDPIIERYVAIKTIRHNAPELETQDIRARFLREAQAAGRLHHPNIVAIYDFGRDADRDFIVMEYAQGDSLLGHMKKHGRLKVEEVCQIMSKVLEALDYAHAMGVVHRDIKPENIMLADNGEVKVADFGIARIESSTLTQVGMVVGTPSYMSPEQLLSQTVDHRSDIFSAGTLLYRLLTGEKPFAGPNLTALIYNIIHSEHTLPSELHPALPVEFDEIVAKALAKRPEARFQTAKAFANALTQVANDETALSRESPAAGAGTVLRTHGLEAGTVPEAQTVVSATGPQVAGEEAKLTGDVKATPGRKGLLVTSGGLITAALAGTIIWIFVAEDGVGLRLPEPAPPSPVEPTPTAKSAAQQPTDISQPLVPEPDVQASLRPDGLATATLDLKPGETFQDCDACPEMVVIPPGSYLRGSPASETKREPSEGPQHWVEIGYPLAVGRHEITKAEFAQFTTETGYQATGCWVYDGQWVEDRSLSWQAPPFDHDNRHPVTCVSWKDAQAYAQWLSQKAQREYRLLSASEWEYVARAGNQSSRYWGDNLMATCDSANVADLSSEQRYLGWQVHDCWDEYVHTAPVGSFKPNDFGLYDMLGNVFEWVADCWNDNYQQAPTDGSAWEEGDCGQRVLRGGSWFSMPRYVRSAFRNRFDPDYRSSSFGFRVARVWKD